MAGSKGRSVTPSHFAMVPKSSVPRSAFDVTHGHKTTFDAGLLIPVYVDEVLPGDSHRVRMTAFARLATPLVPLMDTLILESFFFFVPNRLVWSNWERFMGEQLNLADTTDFLVPQVTFATADLNVDTGPRLGDYMGLTVQNVAGKNLTVNALPFRAYCLIWNEWFRDQDLQDPIPVPVDDGPDGVTQYTVCRKRGKRHDYFTSARPWPAKPVFLSQSGQIAQQANTAFGLPQAGAPLYGFGTSTTAALSGASNIRYSGGRQENNVQSYWGGTELRTKMTAVGTPDIRVLINDIRYANAIQIMMERNARGGTRYAEIVRAHFGVISPDSRLQRPEFLGGGRTFVTINAVAQQSASGVAGTTTVLGELAGIGTAVVDGHGFSQSFTEHGYIIGMVNVRADLSYQQGVHRMWWRRGRYDFYWPGLAHLGEQAILSREIFTSGDAVPDAEVFGYQERWSEYKYKPNRISGRFRSTAPGTLDVWHMSQKFLVRPVLNEPFIQESPPVDRTLQVGGAFNEQFLFDSVFDCRLVRPMPMFSIPGLGPRL